MEQNSPYQPVADHETSPSISTVKTLPTVAATVRKNPSTSPLEVSFEHFPEQSPLTPHNACSVPSVCSHQQACSCKSKKLTARLHLQLTQFLIRSLFCFTAHATCRGVNTFFAILNSNLSYKIISVWSRNQVSSRKAIGLKVSFNLLLICVVIKMCHVEGSEVLSPCCAPQFLSLDTTAFTSTIPLAIVLSSISTRLGPLISNAALVHASSA